MRTTAERRGSPDRSLTRQGQGQRPSVTNPRRGYPDRTKIGQARQLDLKAGTLADLETQRGFTRDRLSIPTGTTDERPTLPFVDILYNETLNRFEGWNGTEWVDLSYRLICVSFTATNQFSYTHNLGKHPTVVVTNSTGGIIEVCVRNADLDTVFLDFNGTLTDAVLLLN